MENLIKYAVGIDVSANKLDVCFGEINTRQEFKVKGKREFANNQKGFKELEPWLKKHQKQNLFLIIVMEATGVYYEKAALYLHQHNYPVAIVLPNKARKYMQALGLKSKNDTIDATGLSRMAAEQKLDLWQPMGDFFYVLRSLTRHHQQLQHSKTLFNNQLHAMQHSAMQVKEIIKHQKQLIALCDKQLDHTLEKIKEHIYTNAEVKKKIENICRIKGLGLLSVAIVIAETNGFELFKNIRQLVSYAGYDVIENTSGNFTGKTKISKKGNSHIRRSMHMPALSTVNCKQFPFTNLFDRVYERTHIKMKAYVAVQKKLLIYIYTLWKKDEPFIEKTYYKTSGNEEPKLLFPLNNQKL
jgi:transposase